MQKAFRFEGDMLSSSIIKAALAWARHGGKIVALHGIDDDGQCTCRKADCKSPGKHPIADLFPKGQHSATSNAIKIRRAFKKYPNANFGVILPPGVVVLDVDGPEGAETFKKLNLPPTLSVRTGRGTHHYFRASEALPKRKAPLLGIDIKDNASGYLVGPPSMHKCGRRYRVRRGETNVAALPSDFVRSLAPTSTRTARFDTVAAFKAGGRNNELTKIAGSLRFRGLAETAIAGALQAINAAACSPPLEADEVERIASSVSKYEANHEEAFGWLGDVEESEPQFLAYPYIVKGAITVLDGNMGQGKSTFTCAIAAAVTTGEPPPFVDEIEQGTVLFMSAEDDPSRVLKPRLMKAGADVSQVRYQDEPFTLDERGLALVRRELTANTPALVIIDPIIAFMQEGANGNNATETMHFMIELDQLARDFDTAILIVRHLRKARADHAMHQGIGSISISARVRSGLILAPHPDDPRKRAIVHAKSNYSETGPAIVFEMESEGPRSHPKLIWYPCEPDLTAAELLAPPEAERGRPPKARDTATAWLESVLRRGPTKKKVLDGMAAANGITMATLRRAGDTLGIVKSKDGKESVWSLP
ncbi:bifunctional DNA primase/polymerase [Aliiroseovarius crassostreae]|uniref:bifunctional DNA primase/polymerase n=1 Tax=Aliiroseovarius crassostreae TaxID=154981 RepID=UPI0021FFF372|nr:bifunctional DNA primase/polymerase [Aliiroseovarius crassostreae]UWQ07128.1 bifunctional DNA primase/polymerase [Aliiroseovarius crassostreae]